MLIGETYFMTYSCPFSLHRISDQDNWNQCILLTHSSVKCVQKIKMFVSVATFTVNLEKKTLDNDHHGLRFQYYSASMKRRLIILHIYMSNSFLIWRILILYDYMKPVKLHSLTDTEHRITGSYHQSKIDIVFERSLMNNHTCILYQLATHKRARLRLQKVLYIWKNMDIVSSVLKCW